MKFVLFFLVLMVSPWASAQTYQSQVGHAPTASASVDQLCDRNRITLSCNPFATNDASINKVVALPDFVGKSLIIGPDANSRARTRDDKDGDFVSAKDFLGCEITDGVADNTACLQRAVAALCSRTRAGGTVYLPGAAYAIQASSGSSGSVTAMCQGLYFEGAGPGDETHGQGGAVLYVRGAGSAPVLQFKSTTFRTPGQYATGGGVRNLVISMANTNGSITQTGPAIDLEQCEQCVIENVRVWQPSIGVRVFGGLFNRITQSQISQVVAGGTAIYVTGTDSGCASVGSCPTRNDVTQIDNVVADFQNVVGAGQSVGDCIHISNFVQTVRINLVGCNGPRRGLWIDCPNSTQMQACPGFITAIDLEVEAGDAGKNDGYNVLAGDFNHLTLTDPQLFGYAVNNNVVVQQTRFLTGGDFQMKGGRVGYARQDCIASNVDQVFIGAGINIQGCGQSGTGYYGAVFRAPATGAINNSITVQGAEFCRNPGTAGTGSPYPMGGVVLFGGTSYAVVTGNRFRSCASGVTDSSGASGAAANVIANNTGL